MYIEKLTDKEIMDICTLLIKTAGGESRNILNYFQRSARKFMPSFRFGAEKQKPLSSSDVIILKDDSNTHCDLYDFRVCVGFSYEDRFGLNDEEATKKLDDKLNKLFRKVMYKKFGEKYLNTYKTMITKEYNDELKFISKEIREDLKRANREYNKGLKNIEDMTK